MLQHAPQLLSLDILGSMVLTNYYIRPHLARTAKDVVIFYSSGLFNSVTNLMISKTSLGIVKKATIKARYSIAYPFKIHEGRAKIKKVHIISIDLLRTTGLAKLLLNKD